MNGRAVLVVGGTGGIGAAICKGLSADWDRVLVGYRRNREAAEKLCRGLSGSAVRIDLTDPANVADVVTAIKGRFDLVMAGGVAIAQAPVGDIRQDQWLEVIEHELLGFTGLVAAALPRLRDQGGGAIVAVTSFANTHFPPGDALSSVPKAGIEALCRAIAKEEGRNGVRANCVAPGMVDAGLGARYQRELFDATIWQRIRRKVPLGRFATADDIAEAVAYLLSAKAAFVTGQTLVVDGGQSL